MPQGLPRKIRIAFLLQVVLVSLAVILAGWLVSLVIRVGFIRSASEAEAADYFARKGMDAAYSLPHGRNFKSWFVPDGQAAPAGLPPSISRLSAGHYDLRDDKCVAHEAALGLARRRDARAIPYIAVAVESSDGEIEEAADEITSPDMLTELLKARDALGDGRGLKTLIERCRARI